MEALTYNGPINLSRLSLKVTINCSPLKVILLDLERKQLVEQKRVKDSILYVATPQARTVLSHFKELNQIIPIAEIKQTNFSKPYAFQQANRIK